MKCFSKKSMMTFIAIAALVALATSPAVATVDLTKPAVVISFSGYDSVIADINAMGEATSQSKFNKLGDSLSAMLKGLSQGKLEAFDLSRPCGLVAYHSEDIPADRPSPFLVFLPVSNMEKFIKVVEESLNCKSKKLGEDHYQFAPDTPGGKEEPMFVKKQGNWVFISTKDLPLDNLQVDPVALLGGLDKKYLFAIQLNGRNQGVKWFEDVLLDWLQAFQQGMAIGMSASMDSTGEMPEVPRPKLSDLGAAGQVIEQAKDQVDTILLGVKFDKAGAKMTDLQLDLQVTALPDTELAKTLAQSPEMPSQFAGFYNTDAAVSMNLSAKAFEGMVIHMKNRLATFKQQALAGLADQDLNEDEQAAAKDWIDRLTKMAEATINEGHLDAGFQLQYNPDDPTASAILLGVKLVDAKQCDIVLRQLGQLLTKQDKMPGKITLDAKTIDGIKLHKIEPVVVPPPLFGPTPECFVGVTKDAIYLGIGNKVAEGLEAAIEKSKTRTDQNVPTVRLSLNIPKILQMAKATSPPEAIDPLVFARLGKGDNKKISFTVVPIKNGVRQSLEISPKVARAIMDIGMAKAMFMPPAVFDSAKPVEGMPRPAGGIGMPRERIRKAD